MKLASEIADAFSDTLASVRPKTKRLTDQEIAQELKQREIQDKEEREERAILLSQLFPDKFQATDLFDTSNVPDIFQ